MVVHTTKETDGIPAPAISIFPYNKDNSAFRLSAEEMEEMYDGDLPCDDYLTKKTYNQSEALIDIFLGFTRKMSILNYKDIVTEEVTRPSDGRYYVFRPTFKIGTNDDLDQIFLVLSRHLHYMIHVYDPHFYVGFYDPSLPMIRQKVEPDDTVGKYYNLMMTEVGYVLQYRSRYQCKFSFKLGSRDSRLRLQFLYLKVIELNLPEDPCISAPGYNFFTCVRKSATKKVDLRPNYAFLF